MASKGFPDPWSDGEYAAYFEKIFGNDRERQSAYLQEILSEDGVSLSAGNRALVAIGEARAVFATNVDTVLEKGVAEVSGRPLAALHIEGFRTLPAATRSKRSFTMTFSAAATS